MSAVLQEAVAAVFAPQGSEEWKQEKCGCASASEFSAILAKGQGKMRVGYLRKLVAERLTGKFIDSRAFGSWQQNLERGEEQELFARASYEIRTGHTVDQVGFIKHPSLAWLGCSPDGVVGTKRGVEIKSVIPTVQVETILAGGYPSVHKAQIQGSLWITERMVWDFCSFSPDMPEHLRTYIHTVERDETYIRTLEAEIRVFLAEVDELVAKLNARGK